MSKTSFTVGEGSVQISSEEIANRIAELGKEITNDYKDKSIHVIGVLNGAFLFMADLVREIDVPMTTDFISVSSYGSRTETSGEVQLLKDLNTSLKNKHVLIVEDIVDSGYTMDYLIEYLELRKPLSIKVASLLSKPSRRKVEVKIHYLGFEIEDAFVYGYGLDDSDFKRNMPFISSYKSE